MRKHALALFSFASRGTVTETPFLSEVSCEMYMKGTEPRSCFKDAILQLELSSAAFAAILSLSICLYLGLPALQSVT